MKIRHRGHSHDVNLGDDGTMDTVVEVDSKEFRFSEADRHRDGRVKRAWLRDSAIEACDDGSLVDPV